MSVYSVKEKWPISILSVSPHSVIVAFALLSNAEKIASKTSRSVPDILTSSASYFAKTSAVAVATENSTAFVSPKTAISTFCKSLLTCCCIVSSVFVRIAACKTNFSKIFVCSTKTSVCFHKPCLSAGVTLSAPTQKSR